MNFVTLYFGFIGILITIMVVPVLLLGYSITRPFSKRMATNYAHFCSKIWGRILVSLVFINAKIEGIEHYNPKETYLITPNHQSSFDIFFGFRIFHKNFAFMSKDDFFKIPAVGAAMILSGYICVKRGTIGAVQSIDDVIDRLNSKRSVVMYPEGTRSLSGEITFPKRGLTRITSAMPDIRILPVVVEGTKNVMSARSWKCYLFKPVKVKFLPPFYMKDIAGNEQDKLDYWFNLIKTEHDKIRFKNLE